MPPKDKKPDKKPEASSLSGVELAILGFIALTVLSTIVPAILNYVSSGQISFFGFKFSGFINFFKNNQWFFRFLGFAVAAAAAFGTFVFNKRGDAVWREEKAKVYPASMPVSSDAEVKKVSNEVVDKWQKILEKSESSSPSDWRLAIIEADIILDDLLQTLNLPGDTMGEKLKAVEKSDFTTIDYAWEAHKARNMVAHQGSDFLLNQRETRRIIALYAAVFKEFYLI